MDAFFGEIRAFCFNYEPQGWLFCNGQLLSTSQFAALFSIIGYNYGGSGNSFNLPNIPGKVLVGAGQMQGGGYYSWAKDGGAETVKLGINDLPPHNHTFDGAHTKTNAANVIVKEPTNISYLSNDVAKTTLPTLGMGYSTAVNDFSELSSNTIGVFGKGGAHSNMQPYMVMNYCICVLDGYYPVKP